MDISPKVFISYSWSSIAHREWVKDLAEHLVANGIDVILDIWELDLGHDTTHFMERIARDKDITKTLLVLDRVYVEKADSRKGGVGAETQIISKEVYEKIGENKFIAIIAERDENGTPYIPIFYNTRMYVDLSTNEAYYENLESLVRAIFGEPLHKKPAPGKKPSFLNNNTLPNVTSPLLYNRASVALREGKPHSIPAIREYFKEFLGKLEMYRIRPDAESFFDDQVVRSIEDFLPQRNELLQLINTALGYADPREVLLEVHAFFEGLAKYSRPPEGVMSYKLTDFDNYVFFAKELFISTVAITLKEGRFSELNEFLSKDFYFKDEKQAVSNLHDFSTFNDHCRSFRHRNDRLNLRRHSIEADLIKERAFGSPVTFDEIMQADLVLLVRARIMGIAYWADTLVFAGHFPRPFEVFARSASIAYFTKFKVSLGVNSKDALVELAGDGSLQRSFDHPFSNLKGLLGLEDLCTRP